MAIVNVATVFLMFTLPYIFSLIFTENFNQVNYDWERIIYQITLVSIALINLILVLIVMKVKDNSKKILLIKIIALTSFLPSIIGFFCYYMNK